NLSHNAHNLLRITRILKCISLFPSLQPHAAVLVTFFAALHEDGHIDLSPSRMHGGSLDKFWAGCFRDEEEREMVVDYVSKRGRFRARGSKV
ncbi:UNVERIFIED_CONTAM: opioid growth factor receptor-related protein, partial [Bacteroidetes bacterium 56_B9]